MKAELLKEIRKVYSVNYFENKIVVYDKILNVPIEVHSVGNDTKEFNAISLMLKGLSEKSKGRKAKKYNAVFKNYVVRNMEHRKNLLNYLPYL